MAESAPPTLYVPGAARPFVAIGAVAVVVGGVAAAVTGPTGWARGSWVAAFLVLVMGVAQIGLGLGQAAFATRTRRRAVGQVLAFNGATLAVIVGTLISAPPVVTVAGLILAGALGSFLVGRHSEPEVPPAFGGRQIYTGLVTFVLLSIPVGLALSWYRRA